MSGFLQQLAEALIAQHGSDLREVAVVLPNRRSALHLRKHLAGALGHAFWSPRCFTLEEFMEAISERKALGTVELLLEFHACLRSVRPGASEPLEEFLQWAPTTLNDMNEVDAHLVDRERFYRDLRAIDELDRWSVAYGHDLSPGQARLVRYWELKRDLHEAFDRTLAERGLGTRGMVERAAADRALKAQVPWSRVWFAGANALTKAQAAVVRAMRLRGLATFAWDADRYYLDDPDQEAGGHLRDLLSEHGPGVIPLSEGLATSERGILVAHAPNTVSQCDLAAQWIAGLTPSERDRTAVLLPDGSLLMPLLRALPRNVGKVNVTMGVPLCTLPVNGLITALLDLHEHGNGTDGMHLDRLAALLMHPFLQGNGNSRTRSLVNALRNERCMFPRLNDLGRLAHDWPPQELAWLFGALRPIGDAAADVPDRIARLIAWARHVVGADVLAGEQLFHAAVVVQRLGTALNARPERMNARSYGMVLMRCLRQERIDLHGEPLEGLQIMGLLETRAIDHDRLIILSAVEGIMPPSAASNSFIPFDVRNVAGLPLPHDGDAVSAYGFYRALQRARHVHLITCGGDATEPSRYISQIERELVPGSRTSFARIEAQLPTEKPHAPPTLLDKGPAVMERIQARLARGLSPSAITAYLNCPLDHWFRYVLALRPHDGGDERLGDDLVGTAVHAALQEVFSPWCGRTGDPNALLAAIPEVPAIVRRSMAKAASGRSVNEGQPLLQAEMAASAIQRYLSYEARRWRENGAPVILALEHSLSVPIDMPGTRDPIPITGFLDRSERHGGDLFVVDYKTGAVHAGDTSIRDIAEVPRNKPYAIQLLIYAWLALRRDPGQGTVRAGIVPLREPAGMDRAFLRIGAADRLERAHLPAVEDFLRSVIQDMLDPERPIAHEPRSRTCRFCAT